MDPFLLSKAGDGRVVFLHQKQNSIQTPSHPSVAAELDGSGAGGDEEEGARGRGGNNLQSSAWEGDGRKVHGGGRSVGAVITLAAGEREWENTSEDMFFVDVCACPCVCAAAHLCLSARNCLTMSVSVSLSVSESVSVSASVSVSVSVLLPAPVPIKSVDIKDKNTIPSN